MYALNFANLTTRQQGLNLFTQKPLPPAVTPDPALRLAGRASDQLLKNGWLFIATSYENHLYVVNPTTRQILAVFPLPFTPGFFSNEDNDPVYWKLSASYSTEAVQVNTVVIEAPEPTTPILSSAQPPQNIVDYIDNYTVETVPSEGAVRFTDGMGEEKLVPVGGNPIRVVGGRKRAFVFDQDGSFAVVSTRSLAVTDRVDEVRSTKPIFTGDDVFVIKDAAASAEVVPLFINDVVLDTQVALPPTSMFEEMQRQAVTINRMRLQTDDPAQFSMPMDLVHRSVTGEVISRREFPGLRLSPLHRQLIIDIRTRVQMNLSTELSMGLTSNSATNMLLL